MIPNKNKKKTLEATVDEMRNFSYTYIEKYSPSKQQLKTYLLKKYLKLNSTGISIPDMLAEVETIGLPNLFKSSKQKLSFGTLKPIE